MTILFGNNLFTIFFDIRVKVATAKKNRDEENIVND